MIDKNDDFLKLIGKEYLHLIEKDNGEYLINQEQMEGLVKAIKFFKNAGGTVEPVKLIPSIISGGATATFTVFDVYKEKCKEFAKIIDSASAVTIDSLEGGDKVCISITIPDLFVEV